MNIFAFEYSCAGGPGGELFLEEGRLMLTSLLDDLADTGSYRVTTLLKSALAGGKITADETVVVNGGFFAAIKKQMEFADAVWIVAPESGGALYRLTCAAQEMGIKVIGSSSDAVKLCGDKLLLARYMHGKIETPVSIPFTVDYTAFPCVVKPVDGAGSENVCFVRDAKALREITVDDNSYLVQPYIEGEKLSASVLSGDSGAVLLGVCKQEMESGATLRLKKVVGPLDYKNRKNLINMVEKIQRLIPGLRGYWGLDFIDRNGLLTLIEINPRLTTSYPLYSGECRFNIAESAAGCVLKKPAFAGQAVKAAR